LRDSAKELILKADSGSETNDKVMSFPFYFKLSAQRAYRLLLAVIISAAMSSTASGLNALASTTAIDIYKRNLKEEKSEKHYLKRQSSYFVLGVVAIFCQYRYLIRKPNPTSQYRFYFLRNGT
jgi:Na+/proline symporter